MEWNMASEHWPVSAGSVIESVIAERLRTNHAKLPGIVKKFFDKYGLGMPAHAVSANRFAPASVAHSPFL
jgi:hypothetical protein